ncbi:unnamed protein product [Camellia sinensis]
MVCTSKGKRGRGKSRSLKLVKLKNQGVRLPIQICKVSGRPYGEASEKFTSELGIVTRQFTPQNVPSWTDISEEDKETLVAYLQEGFKFTNEPYAIESILNLMHDRYKSYRHDLRQRFRSFPTMKPALADPPKNMEKETWKFLCEKWSDKDYKVRCGKNKLNREKLKVLHTAGWKAFRKVQYDERDRATGEELGLVELYKKTHFSEKKEAWVHADAEIRHYKLEKRQEKAIEEGSCLISDEQLSIEVFGQKVGYIRGLGQHLHFCTKQQQTYLAASPPAPNPHIRVGMATGRGGAGDYPPRPRSPTRSPSASPPPPPPPIGYQRDKFGNFKKSLCEDTKGLLSLYEASYLLLEDESILEEARDFTAKHLKAWLKKESIDPNLGMLVSHALELPLHWAMPRMEARWFIDAYERRLDMNAKLLVFAKLDFNMLQAIQQEDLKHASRCGGRAQVEGKGYPLLGTGWWRIIYGLWERLLSLSSKILGAWEQGSIYWQHVLMMFMMLMVPWMNSNFSPMPLTAKQLPDYMKICFLGLFNTINEMAYVTLKEHGVHILPYLKNKEARWSYSGCMPTLEEYLDHAWTSSFIPTLLTHAYFLSTNAITNEELECIEKCDDIIKWSSMVARLADDLGTSWVWKLIGLGFFLVP